MLRQYAERLEVIIKSTQGFREPTTSGNSRQEMPP